MHRSSITESSSIDPLTDDGPSNYAKNYFLVPGSTYAIAAREKLTDTVWFVKIPERPEADQPYTDDYGFTVPKRPIIFQSESIWSMLAKQDTKHIFKK